MSSVEQDLEADTQEQQFSKPACTTCAKRKVKCDRLLPSCGDCLKRKAECHYEDPVPTKRSRKRRQDGELLERISYLERLLQQYGIDPSEGEDSREQKTWFNGGPTSRLPNRPKEPDSSALPVGKSITSGITILATKLPNVLLGGPFCRKIMRTGSDNDSSPSTWSLLPLHSSRDLFELHPKPQCIIKLWQIFAERTNPVVKILHTCTLQQRILDESWNLEQSAMSFHALLFAIYLLAVISLSDAECQEYFREGKTHLVKRYRSSTWQALMLADVFETRELETLQAFLLFLLADPGSDYSTTLSGVATRLARKMGLDKDSSSNDISLFEQEMRIRLWWQIYTHEILASHLGGPRDDAEEISIPSVRLPLNVNDADLHPDMVKQPVEYPRATEMICVLLRYEGPLWAQRRRARSLQRSVEYLSIEDLERFSEQKYLCHCDARIPLQAAAQTMVRSGVCVGRYLKARMQAHDSTVPNDTLFDRAIEVLELDEAIRRIPFASQLVWHGGLVQLDSVIYILSTLRRRSNVERMTRAWNLVVQFWQDHGNGDPGDDAVAQDPAFISLADMTLDVWRLVNANSLAVAPPCIKRLQQIRGLKDCDAALGRNRTEPNVLVDGNGFAPFLSQDEMNFDIISPDLLYLGNDWFNDFGSWGDFSQL